MVFDLIVSCRGESHRFRSPRVAVGYAKHLAKRRRAHAHVTVLLHEGRCRSVGYADRLGRFHESRRSKTMPRLVLGEVKWEQS